jgi:hypothetical protein
LTTNNNFHVVYSTCDAMTRVPRLRRSIIIRIDNPALPGWADVWRPALRAWVLTQTFTPLPSAQVRSGDPDFLYVARLTTACAAFNEESRMKFANANEPHRKSAGTWGTRPGVKL